MTFSLRPAISKRWRFSSLKSSVLKNPFPWIVFLVLLLQGVSLGLSDDEAYYWVLAQKPALGYAFHPPVIAWAIWLSQFLLGWLSGPNSALVARFPAALCSAGIVAFSFGWLEKSRRKRVSNPVAASVILGFAGVFSLAWMSVPDLPLFLGWTMAFSATWSLCHSNAGSREELLRQRILLLAGLFLAILSKFSGVLAAGSAAACLFFWAPRKTKTASIATVLAAVALASIPILLWNATHGWGSILYQIRDRHEGARLSLVRYLRFWAIELVLAGPALLAFVGISLKREIFGASRAQASELKPIIRFVMVWVLPGALVFCTQPLFSDFKPHWALIVWWPFVLALAWARIHGYFPRIARFHSAYGFALIGFVFFASHFPIGNFVLHSVSDDGIFDPRLDVTNDFYGWSSLPAFLDLKGDREIPVIGSRYQTAAQAAFSLGRAWKVTMIPRDLKARDEWPEYQVSDGVGPSWPKLTEPVIYVADNRYTEGPGFQQAACVSLGRVETRRLGYLAKWIDVWSCEPLKRRP